MGMQSQEVFLFGAGGLPLFARLWKPSVPAIALVVIVHGHGEHSGRYAHVAQALSERGLAVSALDMRGHGHSEGPRGFVRLWEEYRTDIRQLIEHLRDDFDQIPHFLYGHSLGATACLDYAIRDPEDIRGLIASAPALAKPNIPAYLFTISKLLSWIYPKFSLATQLDQTALSRDPEVVKAYREDPLVHGIGTARLGIELLQTVEFIVANASRLEMPLLLIHGAQDRLVNPVDTRRLFDIAEAMDKTLVEIPDGFHEPHNDLDKAMVIKTVGDWIEARL
jgi:alpha-beta hydrolase superfamily lysophospholipase